MTLTSLAPAKINRELRVGGFRSDGYHEIYSRMVAIDLCDRLIVEASNELDFSCDDPAVPLGDANLVVRAAKLLAARAGVRATGRIRLEKRVPMGGGLGGGSADAAIALKLLARFWNLGAPSAEVSLSGIAAEIGSDVPFFLTGGQADVRGRGEIVTPAEDSRDADLVLLVPPFSISTAGVYRAYGGRGRLPATLSVDAAGAAAPYLGPNDLAPAVLQMEPRMQAYLESAARVTSDFAISGSGATIVLCGVAADDQRKLAQRHPEARFVRCRPLSRTAYSDRTNPTGGAP